MNPQDPLVRDVVVLGDLFDKAIVNPTVVLMAFNIIITALNNNPNIRYTLIPGNHDLSKDISKKSSYELLYYLLLPYKDITNLNVLFKEPMYLKVFSDKEEEKIHSVLTFDCYFPFQEDRVSFKDIIKESFDPEVSFITFGHYDNVDILGNEYLPLPDFLEYSDLIVSGHYHTPVLSSYALDDVKKSSRKVVFAGSMQPYTHAEDPDKYIYITLTPEELEDIDLKTLKNKCVRIYCDNDFALTSTLDCLSLSYLYKEKEEELDEPTLQAIENTYTSSMITAMTNIQTESEYEKELLIMFKEKSYLNVSN